MIFIFKMNIQSIVFLFVIYITLSKKSRVFGYKEVMVNGVRNILALQSERVNVVCNPNNTIPLEACTFIHPNNTIFEHSATKIKNDVTCELEVRANMTDVGLWKCFSDIHTVQEVIQFRVEKLFTAIENKIVVLTNDEITLRFTIVTPNVPITYCQFAPPMDKIMTVYPYRSPIYRIPGTYDVVDRYEYPEEADMKQGNCWLKIKKISPRDVGTWHCTVKVPIGYASEITSSLELYGLEKYNRMETPDIVLVTFFALTGLAVAGLCYRQYKQRRELRRRETRNEFQMQEIAHSSRASMHRSSSTRHRVPKNLSTPTTPSLATDASSPTRPTIVVELVDSSSPASPTEEIDESPPSPTAIAWFQRFLPWPIPIIRVTPPSTD